MANDYKDLQEEFIAEMRKAMPPIIAWWNANAITPHTDIDESPAQNDFEYRWIAGPLAHPRLLHIVRTYVLRVIELNQDNEEHRAPPDTRIRDTDWGMDEGYEDDVRYEVPVDLLVHDLEEKAPDVFEVVKELTFVPIARSPEGRYC